MNSRGGYTPPELINSSSENELRGRGSREACNQRESRTGRQEGIERATRLTFTYFLQAPENYFSKSKVLILLDLSFSTNLQNQLRRNS